MGKKLIVFMGSNGSGKTSYAEGVIRRLSNGTLGTRKEIIFDGKKRYITVGNNFKAIGKYEPGKCGGADTWNGVGNVLDYLMQSTEEIIVLEGVLLNSWRCYETYVKTGREVYVFHLKQSDSHLLSRLHNRNGGKSVGKGFSEKNKHSQQKAMMIPKQLPSIRLTNIDTEKNSIEQGLQMVFKATGI